MILHNCRCILFTLEDPKEFIMLHKFFLFWTEMDVNVILLFCWKICSVIILYWLLDIPVLAVSFMVSVGNITASQAAFDR